MKKLLILASLIFSILIYPGDKNIGQNQQNGNIDRAIHYLRGVRKKIEKEAAEQTRQYEKLLKELEIRQYKVLFQELDVTDDEPERMARLREMTHEEHSNADSDSDDAKAKNKKTDSTPGQHNDDDLEVFIRINKYTYTNLWMLLMLRFMPILSISVIPKNTPKVILCFLQNFPWK